jgi:hypothetical protein
VSSLADERPSTLTRASTVLKPRLALRLGLDRWGAVALVLGLVLTLSYVVVVPPFESPDENSHYEYAVRMAQLRRVPTFEDRSPELVARVTDYMVARGLGLWIPTPDGGKEIGFGQELGRQPPWYYVVPALLGQIVSQPMGLQVRVMRLVSVACGVGVVVLAIAAGRIAFPGDPFAQRALPLLVALTPGFLFIAGSINNDNLANLGGALSFLGMFLAVRRGRIDARALVVIVGGLVLALAGKRTALALLPTAAIVLYLLWAARRRHPTLAAAVVVVPLLGLVTLPDWALVPTPRVAGWQTARAGQPSRSDEALAGAASLLVGPEGGPPARLMQVLSTADVARAGARGLTAAAWVRSVDGAPGHAQLGFDQGIGLAASTTVAIDETWRLLRVAFRPNGPGAVRVSLTADGAAALFDAVVVAPGELVGAPDLDDPDGKTGVWNGEPFANLVANGSGEAAERGLRPPVAAIADLVGAPSPTLVAVGSARLLPPDLLSQRFSFTFEGYLGRFSWLSLSMPDWTYQAAWLVVAVGVVGFLVRLIRPRDGRDRAVLALCVLGALSAIVVGVGPFLIGVMGGELPQGRYLYPSVVPLTAVVAAGLSRFVPVRRADVALAALTAAGLTLNVVAIGGTLIPYYAGRA